MSLSLYHSSKDIPDCPTVLPSKTTASGILSSAMAPIE